MLGFGDVRGLLNEIKEVHGSDSSQRKLMEKVSKGRFTLRDMYKQFNDVIKMGPMNKVMGMIPGIPEYLIPRNGDDGSSERLKKFMYMMDSMTDKELDGKVDLHNKKGDDNTIEMRIRRIARGSGTHPNEVKQLLLSHKQFEGMVSKMGKTGMMKSMGSGKQKQMSEYVRKNPRSFINHLNKINPKILQQIGGN